MNLDHIYVLIYMFYDVCKEYNVTWRFEPVSFYIYFCEELWDVSYRLIQIRVSKCISGYM